MSLYDVILKELDLNEGDEFILNRSCYVYRVFDGQFEYRNSSSIYWRRSLISVHELMNGITITKRAPWVPKVGETYYTPIFGSGELCYGYQNYNNEFDTRVIVNKLAFKTSEEAIACAKKMLDAIKEDRC